MEKMKRLEDATPGVKFATGDGRFRRGHADTVDINFQCRCCQGDAWLSLCLLRRLLRLYFNSSGSGMKLPASVQIMTAD